MEFIRSPEDVSRYVEGTATGGGVYANRPQLGDWERWTLIRNDDGSVSFRSIGGHYLVAESGGGSVLNANRTSIGEWEKFWIYFLPGGRIALKTYVTGHFVSIKTWA